MPKTGALKWHFQYTPHDVWDWDAQQPPVLVDAEWQGQPRRLLLHANRNGFFYVLDRTTGALLLAKPFVEEAHLGARDRAGRPSRPRPRPGAERRRADGLPGGGRRHQLVLDVVPSRRPASTTCRPWRSARSTRTRPQEWEAGKSYYGGTTKDPEEPGQKVLRAIDIQTGAIAWELPQTGAAQSWGGSRWPRPAASSSSARTAARSWPWTPSTGAPLWHFQANTLWKASPMTYTFDGRQHVAVAAGSSILSFALVE